MDLQKIYNQYNIPLNLQRHMLRVASLAQIITEDWQGAKIDQQAIIQACLFHDMANIIKFNFDRPALFEEEQNKTAYWKSIQKKVIKKYGNNLHLATLQICQEISLSPKVLTLKNNSLLLENSLIEKISIDVNQITDKQINSRFKNLMKITI